MASVASFFAKEIQKLSELLTQKDEALHEATGNKKLSEVIEENVRLKKLLEKNPDAYFAASSVSPETLNRIQQMINAASIENQNLHNAMENARKVLSQKESHILQLQAALKSSEAIKEDLASNLAKRNQEIQNSEQNKVVVSEKLAQSSILHEQGIGQLRNLWSNEKSQLQAYFSNREMVKNKQISEFQIRLQSLSAEKGKLLSQVSYFKDVLQNVSEFIGEKEEAIRKLAVSQAHYVTQLEGENKLLKQEINMSQSRMQSLATKSQRISLMEHQIEKSKIWSEGIIQQQGHLLSEMREYIRQYQSKLNSNDSFLKETHLANTALSAYIAQGNQHVSTLEKKIASAQEEAFFYKTECSRFRALAEEISKEARNAQTVPEKVVETLYADLRGLSNELGRIKGILAQVETKNRLSESSNIKTSQEISQREAALFEWINKAQYFYTQWTKAMEALNAESFNYQKLANSCLQMEREVKQARSLQASGYLEEARKKLIESNMDEVIIKESLTYKALEAKCNHLSSSVASFQAEIDLLKRAIANTNPNFYAQLSSEIEPVMANNRVLNENLIKAYAEIDELKKGVAPPQEIPKYSNDRFEKELHSQKTLVSKLSQDISVLNRDLSDMNSRIFELEAQNQELQHANSNLLNELETESMEKAKIARVAEDLKAKMKKVELFVNEIEN